MSINRNLATFAKDVQTDGTLQDSSVRGISVTVTVSAGKFVIDGTSQQTMFIPKGVKYRFDVSDSSVSGHPLVFSTTSDGTHGGGSAYTTGITTSGTAGSSGAYVEVQLQQDAPDLLYYYCSNHSGMGAGAETAPQGSTYGNSDVDTHLNYSSATSGQVLGYNGSDYAWVSNAGYTDSDVDTHLNTSGATGGDYLYYNGSDYSWQSALGELSDDTSPQLGGNLDVVTRSIVSTSNRNINITPNGSGKVVLDGLSYPDADGSANYVLKTDGSGNLGWSAVSSLGGTISELSDDTTPQLGGDLDVVTRSIVSTSNRDINISPNGTGTVVINTDLDVDNINIDGNSITSTDTNGNINITPNGTGKIVLDGLSFPTSDGSADQVLKTDGSGNLSFVAQSSGGGGGSVQATASGALANGDMVIVNSDGTVSAIGTQSVSASTGSAAVFENSNIVNTSTAYDPVNNKIVVTYTDEGDNDYGKVVVGSLSGSTITFGTPVNFNASKTGTTKVIYDTNAAKFVILYDTGHSTYNGKAIVGTVSGTTMTFGSAVTFHSASTSHITGYYDPDEQKIVVGYKKNSNSNGIVIVGTVSGTSISFGSENVFDDDAREIHLSYDENVNKTLIVYADNDNSLYGTAKVGTISGTSMSFGSATVFETAQMSSPSAVYDSSSQKMVVHYIDNGNSSHGTAIVATISGTSVSFGSAVVFNSGSTSRISAVYNSAAAKIVVSYRDQGNSNYPTIIEGTVSGTTPSYGSEVALASISSNYISSVYNSSSKSVITSYSDAGNSSYGTSIVRISSYNVTRSLTSENFIGVSDAAYSDGATATIQTAGSTDDAQSGLTAGESYYVQADGSLGTSPDTIAVMAGTAVSATQLLINPDTNPAIFGNTQVDAHLNVSGASSGQILSWNGSDYAWTADGGGLNVVSSHSKTLSSDTTVAATDNAMSVGPLTVASGVTLTVASGARYVVV